MKRIYSIFVIGAILASPIPIIDNLDELDELEELKEFGEHPVESYMHFVKTGANVWMFSYLIILAAVILIRMIPTLNTRLSKNQLLALSFVSGQSFGFVVIRLLTFSFKL